MMGLPNSDHLKQKPYLILIPVQLIVAWFGDLMQSTIPTRQDSLLEFNFASAKEPNQATSSYSKIYVTFISSS